MARTLRVEIELWRLILALMAQGIFVSAVVARLNVVGDTIRFAVTTFIHEHEGARSVVVADMNNDGRKDIVVGINNPPGPDERLRIFWQDSQGKINPTPTFLDTVRWAVDMQAVDLNKDGLTDLVIADQYGNGVRIFYQDSSGGITEGAIKEGSYGSAALKAADLNNDGLIDIATTMATEWGTPDSLVVYYQQPGAKGKFDSVTMYPLYKNSDVGWANIQVSDMNGDGLTDVVVVGGELDRQVSIFLQQPSGGLQLNQNLGFELYPFRCSAIIDFDRDGRNDIVIAQTFGTVEDPIPKLWIYKQDSTGHFPDTATVKLDAFDLPEIIKVADMDLDGLPDLFVTHENRYANTIYRMKQGGGFEPYLFFSVANRDANIQAMIDIGDFSSDGWPDIVTVSLAGTVYLMLNETGKNGTTEVGQWLQAQARTYILHQNYPNPFNPITTIQYELPRRSRVLLKVFDVVGREVSSLVDGEEDAGLKSVNFTASGLTSGIYFCRLTVDGLSQTRKMLLLQ